MSDLINNMIVPETITKAATKAGIGRLNFYWRYPDHIELQGRRGSEFVTCNVYPDGRVEEV